MDANRNQQDGNFVGEFFERVGGRWVPSILARLASGHMAMAVGVMTISAMATTASAFEFGSPGFEIKPGLLLGVTAAPLPPGWYGDDRLITYQAHLVGPGAPVDANGSATRVKADAFLQTLIWASGWSVPGGAYEVAVVQPVVSENVGSPINGRDGAMQVPSLQLSKYAVWVRENIRMIRAVQRPGVRTVIQRCTD